MIQRIDQIRKHLLNDFPFAASFHIPFTYEYQWREQPPDDGSLQPGFKLIGDLVEPGSSVLDIGCGDGKLLRYLARERGATVAGIEVSQNAVTLAAAQGVPVMLGNVTQDDFQLTEQYDYVIMTDVLEHLHNAEEVISKLKGRFRNSLLVGLPNSGFVVDRLRLLFGRFPKQWHIHPSEHVRFWTLSDFVFWCRQLGLEVEAYYGVQIQFSEFLPKLFWRWYPRLFSRKIVYVLKEMETGGR